MKTIKGIKDMMKRFEGVKMATTATRFYGDIRFLLGEQEKEYWRFYEGDGEGPTFANTKMRFEIGDHVLLNGKEYEIEGFYRSSHAKTNEVDWLRLRRLESRGVVWCDAYPSEVRLLSRPVK